MESMVDEVHAHRVLSGMTVEFRDGITAVSASSGHTLFLTITSDCSFLLR